MLLVHKEYGSLAVIITCHRYEHFLSEAIESVLSQGIMLEIIVVDDMPQGSQPTECEKVLEKWQLLGNVKRIETKHGEPLKARQAGFNACDSEYVCFLDADDKLGEGYLEEALRLLTTSDVIYSDIQYFGTEDRQTDFPDNISPGRIALGNFLHVGCVTKRKVIEAAHAFEHPPLTNYHEDWYFWRKILSAGFAIHKQKHLYHARQHDHNRSTHLKELDYYQTRGTAGDIITFCDLRQGLSIRRKGQFPSSQNWSIKQRNYQDYPRHIDNRLDKINHAIRTAWTDFLFFYDSLHEYRPNVCERLLRKMNSQVAIAHNTDFTFLDCTIVAVPMIRGKVLSSEDELKQLRIIYV